MKLTRQGVCAFVLGFLLMWCIGPAFAQHQHLGPHPAPGQHDPFGSASSVRSEFRPQGINCCHGKDCARYDGPPPERVKRGNEWGYLFAGRWFFEDWRRMDVSTMDPEIRGEAALCIMRHGEGPEAHETPLCFHWPTNG